jgi:hypothetical protein
MPSQSLLAWRYSVTDKIRNVPERRARHTKLQVDLSALQTEMR